jgi:hypothetical protein
MALDAGWWMRERWARVLRVVPRRRRGDAAVAELPDGRVLVVDTGFRR